MIQIQFRKFKGNRAYFHMLQTYRESVSNKISLMQIKVNQTHNNRSFAKKPKNLDTFSR